MMDFILLLMWSFIDGFLVAYLFYRRRYNNKMNEIYNQMRTMGWCHTAEDFVKSFRDNGVYVPYLPLYVTNCR